MRFASVRKAFADSSSFSVIEALESRRLLSVGNGTFLEAPEQVTAYANVTDVVAGFKWIHQTKQVDTAAWITGEVSVEGGGSVTGGRVLFYDGQTLVGSTGVGSVTHSSSPYFSARVNLPAGGERTLRVVYEPAADPTRPAETTITVTTLSAAQDAQRQPVQIIWDRFENFIVVGADNKPLPSGFIEIRHSWDSANPDPFLVLPVINGHAHWEHAKLNSGGYGGRSYVRISYSGDINHKPAQRDVSHDHPKPLWYTVLRTMDGGDREQVATGDEAVLKLRVSNFDMAERTVDGPIEVWRDGRIIARGEAKNGLARINLGVLPAGEHVVYVRYAGQTVEQGLTSSAHTADIARITVAVSDSPAELPSEERSPSAVRITRPVDGSLRLQFVGLKEGLVRFRLEWAEREGDDWIRRERTIERTLDEHGVVALPASEFVEAAGYDIHPTLLRDACHEQLEVGNIDFAIRTSASFDGDGGQTEVAFTGPDGKRYTRMLHLPASAWSLKAIADADRDGFEDLLWQHGVTGKVVVWKLSPWANIRGIDVLHRGGGQWVLSDVRDENHDGSVDYIWTNPTNNKTAVWFTAGKGRITSFEIR
jgi:hypothetical protein